MSNAKIKKKTQKPTYPLINNLKNFFFFFTVMFLWSRKTSSTDKNLYLQSFTSLYLLKKCWTDRVLLPYIGKKSRGKKTEFKPTLLCLYWESF